MCGIVGYTGKRPALDVLLDGLRRLEYRGYDSSGVALLQDGDFFIKKSEGKLANVEKLLGGLGSDQRQQMTSGIGHTRWATHGKPTTQNAHPHRTGDVVLVHNGIIENYLEIREELVRKGHQPQSETDSELFGFLVSDAMAAGAGLADAVRDCFSRIRGSCTIVVMSRKEPGKIVAVRNGTPLVAAQDPEGGAILASDAQPLVAYTRDVYFVEDGEMVVGTPAGIEFFDLATGKKTQKNPTRIEWSVDRMDKQGFDHYMLKEIFEQPVAVVDTLNALIDRGKPESFPLADEAAAKLLASAKRIIFVACGSSWHSALVGKYWLERWARVPIDVELASEFRYSDPVIEPGTIVVGITQSGETADTLAVLKDMKKKGVPTLGLANVRGSTISREADACFFTAAGPEIGVAATKSFSAQLMGLVLWAGYLARTRKSQNASQGTEFFSEILKLPHVLNEFLQVKGDLDRITRSVAEKVSNSRGFFFVGRGYSFPLALEGALKLKEIAYVHAEGYAAGELKHGPIAMLDESMTVVVLAPQDSWRDKSVSNLEEVRARGAKVIGIGDENDSRMKSLCDHWIPLRMSGLDEAFSPFLLGPAVQLLSYHLAVLKGTDVDKPRNLAKSVTVE